MKGNKKQCKQFFVVQSEFELYRLGVRSDQDEECERETLKFLHLLAFVILTTEAFHLRLQLGDERALWTSKEEKEL